MTSQPIKQMISTLKTTVNRPYDIRPFCPLVGVTLVTHTGEITEVKLIFIFLITWQSIKRHTNARLLSLGTLINNLGYVELTVDNKNRTVVNISAGPCLHCRST